MKLTFPPHLPESDRAMLVAMAERNLADHGDGFLGLVLTGSAGRAMATRHSDLDVFVVLSDEAATDRRTSRSSQVDEIPWPLSEMDTVAAFGTEDWWYRWSCAWAPVLWDRTDGRITEALLRQARLSLLESDAILIDHDRLDGWINFAYRALKSDRDQRPFESRLDACESVPWLLDVIFSLAGRVRPYNKYLVWELTHHPLVGWDGLAGLVERTLAGDVTAVRETFASVEVACRDYDAARGHTLATDMINGWGVELAIFRG